jgi:CheY-like chemotaxis protein
MARVLIIEDNGEVRALWVLALTLAGHEVSEAAHGWDGLELVRRWHPRVVLTDLNLPGVHGLDIIRHVRQEQPDIMVIAASGSDRDLEVAQRLGVFRAFSKPVATHRLIAAISGAVLAQRASPASDALPRAGPPAAP